MVGFDFALPLGGSGFDGVAVDAELGEALAEGVRLERRALIELEAVGQSPLGHRALEHLERGWRVGGQGDAGRQHIAGVVVEDAQHMDVNARPAFESHGEGALGVELPALVGVVGLVAGTALGPVSPAQPFDAAIGGMGAQVAGEGRAA